MILTFILLSIGAINANKTDGLEDYADLNQKKIIFTTTAGATLDNYHSNLNEQNEDNQNTNANTNLFNKKKLKI